ncbi:hypothetical protein ACLOJK_034390 [Asimina triloba]
MIELMVWADVAATVGEETPLAAAISARRARRCRPLQLAARRCCRRRRKRKLDTAAMSHRRICHERGRSAAGWVGSSEGTDLAIRIWKEEGRCSSSALGWVAAVAPCRDRLLDGLPPSVAMDLGSIDAMEDGFAAAVRGRRMDPTAAADLLSSRLAVRRQGRWSCPLLAAVVAAMLLLEEALAGSHGCRPGEEDGAPKFGALVVHRNLCTCSSGFYVLVLNVIL